MAAMVINGMDKRKKEQHDHDDDNNECLSHTNKKPRRVVWSHDLHTKFVNAVNLLGLHDAVPRKIVALMNVDGITTAHVASHLQKYRLRNKKAADSSLIDQPTQSQNISFNKKAADRVPSSSLIQPTQSQNIIHPPFYKFPVTQNTTLLPNKMPVHQSHTVPAEIYSNTTGVSPLFPTLVNHSATAFDFHDTMAANFPLQMNSHHTHDVLGSASSTLIQPIQSQNHMFPVYHQTSTFPTLVNHSTTPLGFPTTFDFHDTRATNYPFVGSAFSKTTSILDDDWYTKYMNMEPHLLQFPNNSFSVLESDKTSQNSQMKNSQQTKPFIDGSPSSLEDTNINISESNLCNENSLMKNSHQPEPFIDASPSSLEDINIDISESNLCSENSPIDFSVETNCNTLEWGCLEEDLINVWRWLEEENVTNVML